RSAVRRPTPRFPYTTLFRSQIMVEAGAITAQTDSFVIRVKGRGGHGARPHEATDAIVVASLLITAIQTLISRETNPFHPSVITVGKIAGGSAANVIAEDVLLEGTLRTTSPEGRRRIVNGLERMCKATAELHGARIDIDFQFGCPPVINSPRETELARAAALKVDRKSTRLNSSHVKISYAVFCLTKKNKY